MNEEEKKEMEEMGLEITNCPITNKEIHTNCFITIDYGYPSPKDWIIYKFQYVHHDVGEALLEKIKELNPKIDLESYSLDQSMSGELELNSDEFTQTDWGHIRIIDEYEDEFFVKNLFIGGGRETDTFNLSGGQVASAFIIHGDGLIRIEDSSQTFKHGDTILIPQGCSFCFVNPEEFSTISIVLSMTNKDVKE